MTYVLDAFALLAHFKKEPGASRVALLLDQAVATEEALFMPAVNLGEVFYKTVRQFNRERAYEVLAAIQQLPIQIVDIDQQLALDAALLKATYPISYADCIAAVLAQRLNATLVTGDTDFEKIPDLDVEWLEK